MGRPCLGAEALTTTQHITLRFIILGLRFDRFSEFLMISHAHSRENHPSEVFWESWFDENLEARVN